MAKLAAKIITCPEWDARPPKSVIQTVKHKAHGIVFHHTAGHHAEISKPASIESRGEAIAYARAIQRQHMDGNGWIDSGHNFLVCRNGLVLQGRWHTVAEIERGRMVESAHCPGYNDWIGIEHEHNGVEAMTHEQHEASAYLMAWIAQCYGMAAPLAVTPHSAHFATACPGNLKAAIPAIVNRAREILVGA